MENIGMRLGAPDVILETNEVRRPQRIFGDEAMAGQVVEPVGAGHGGHSLEVFLIGFRGM
jgi:hypothetical protein